MGMPSGTLPRSPFATMCNHDTSTAQRYASCSTATVRNWDRSRSTPKAVHRPRNHLSSALRKGSTLVEQAVRKKCTIGEIRESKKTGEKMVYTSVPDYTSARWAEMAGVDVAVVGDSR